MSFAEMAAAPRAVSVAVPLAESQRLHGLDALRGFALVLGVVLHAALSYMPGQPFWLITDTAPSATLGVSVVVIHMFRMLVFFILAGYFARMGVEKLGARGFMRDRAKRIGLPFALGWPLMMGLIVFTIVWGAMVAKKYSLPMPAEAPPPRFSWDSFPLTHLWFLYVLMLFYGAAMLLRTLPAGLARTVDRIAPMLVSPIGAVLFALPLAAAMLNHPGWRMWFGIPTPDMALLPNLSSCIAYCGGFALGWAVQRNGELLEVWRRQWQLNLGIAVAMTMACLALGGFAPTVQVVPASAITVPFAVLYAIGCWTWSFALIGMALRFFNQANAKLRYLADASYWIYFIHLPLVIALQIEMAKLDWPWQLEFPLLLAIAFVIMLAAYRWMVRGTWIGAILNGKRKN